MNDEYKYIPLMNNLVKTVVQTFYSAYHIIIIDLLIEERVLSEDELCSKMKLLQNEFNKMILELKEDKIVKFETKSVQLRNERSGIKILYYIDYSELRDILKYKMYKIYKTLQETYRKKTDMYICMDCNQIYTALDAQINMKNDSFYCTNCDTELVENMDKSTTYTIDHKEIFVTLERILDLLKKVSKYYIPPVNVFKLENLKFDSKDEEIISNRKNDLKSKDDENLAHEEDNIIFTKPITNILKDKIEAKSLTTANTIMVSVNNELKPIDQITEMDQENMTDDEYVKYFELCEKK